MIPEVFIRCGLNLNNELLSVGFSVFEILQGFSDPPQPTFPQPDAHWLERARFEELGEFLGELIDVVVVVFRGWEDVSEHFEGLVEH